MQKGNSSHEENIAKQNQHMKKVILKRVRERARDCQAGYNESKLDVAHGEWARSVGVAGRIDIMILWRHSARR